MKVKMKGEEHILVNFPIDTSLKKKAHSALCEYANSFHSKKKPFNQCNGEVV